MLKDQIQVFIVFGFDNSLKLYYVGVIKLVQNGDLPICSLSVDFVLEGIEHFFKGVCFLGRLFSYLPYMTICAASKEFVDLEEVLNAFLNFFRHFIMENKQKLMNK